MRAKIIAMVMLLLLITIVGGGFFYFGQKYGKEVALSQDKTSENNILTASKKVKENSKEDNHKEVEGKANDNKDSEESGEEQLHINNKKSIIDKEYEEMNNEKESNKIVKLATAKSNKNEFISMRAGRSWGFKEVRKIPKGEVMEILGERLGWYRVKYKDVVAYVNSGDVTVSEGQAPKEPKIEEPYEYVDYEDALINRQVGFLKDKPDVYIRKDKRKDSKTLKKLSFRTGVSILEICKDGWIKVADGNIVGYVPKSDFSQIDSTTFRKRLGTINSNNIKIMNEPFDNSEIITTLNEGDEVIVVGDVEKDYYNIELESRGAAWVKAEDIVVTPWKKRIHIENSN